MRIALPQRLTALRPFLATISFAAAGGVAALWIAQRPVAAEAPALPRHRVTVAGEAFEKGSDIARWVGDFADRWEATPVTFRIGPESVESTRAELHVRVDRAHLEARLSAAQDPDSRLRQHYARTRRSSPRVDIPVPLEVDEAALLNLLLDRKDEIDHAAVDARMDPRSGEVLPHRDGALLDVHGTLEILRERLGQGASQVEARVEMTPAGRTGADLAHVSVDHVLGFFETRYNASAEARDRTFNLTVAASRIDGHVVLPGETFDFNQLVGERSEANGFRPATVIAGGELVDGLGGGTCQVAGTLHAAAYFAGLEIVERRPHSRPSTYIYMGLDAVVSYPQLNLRFENNLSTPVVIGFTVEGGVARAEIRGATQRRLVTFVRRVDAAIPFREREVSDPDLPSGVRVLQQRGVAGFRVRHWRIVRDLEINQAIRTVSNDDYPATDQIWRVGSGADPSDSYRAPPGDDHPEYTADAYLSVSQGESIRGLRVVRRAGRTGSAGWTESFAPSSE